MALMSLGKWFLVKTTIPPISLCNLADTLLFSATILSSVVEKFYLLVQCPLEKKLFMILL